LTSSDVSIMWVCICACGFAGALDVVAFSGNDVHVCGDYLSIVTAAGLSNKNGAQLQ